VQPWGFAGAIELAGPYAGEGAVGWFGPRNRFRRGCGASTI